MRTALVQAWQALVKVVTGTTICLLLPPPFSNLPRRSRPLCLRKMRVLRVVSKGLGAEEVQGDQKKTGVYTPTTLSQEEGIETTRSS
jgi:hypothetical protein